MKKSHSEQVGIITKNALYNNILVTPSKFPVFDAQTVPAVRLSTEQTGDLIAYLWLPVYVSLKPIRVYHSSLCSRLYSHVQQKIHNGIHALVSFPDRQPAKLGNKANRKSRFPFQTCPDSLVGQTQSHAGKRDRTLPRPVTDYIYLSPSRRYSL